MNIWFKLEAFPEFWGNTGFHVREIPCIRSIFLVDKALHKRDFRLLFFKSERVFAFYVMHPGGRGAILSILRRRRDGSFVSRPHRDRSAFTQMRSDRKSKPRNLSRRRVFFFFNTVNMCLSLHNDQVQLVVFDDAHSF